MEQSKAQKLAGWLRAGMPAGDADLSTEGAAEELLRLEATVDDADRRAGAAARELESALDGARRRASWLRTAKAQAGYSDNTSFDVVWAEALAALLEKRAASGTQQP